MICAHRVARLLGFIMLLGQMTFAQSPRDDSPSRDQLRDLAVQIAEGAARYDLLMREIDALSVQNRREIDDSLELKGRIDLPISNDFVENCEVRTPYNTTQYGFEEFEIRVVTKGHRGHDYTYRIALTYDGGVYRLFGFAGSDFQNLIKRVFRGRINVEEAKLIAKWYFGFHNINLAFHEKTLRPTLRKEITNQLNNMQVLSRQKSIVLVDYSTSFYSSPTSHGQVGRMNDGGEMFDVNVAIHKSIIQINTETRDIVAKNDVIKVIRLKNAHRDEFEIPYSF